MKTLYSILFFIILSPVLGQVYNVQGTVQLVSYSQGGVELREDAYLPHPVPETRFYIVEYLGEHVKPKVVQTVRTNSMGKFLVQLPAGKYGIVSSNKRKDLSPGQYLPTMPEPIEPDSLQMPDFGYSHQDYWQLNSIGPFEISKDSIPNVVLTHYDVRICYLCP